ncbi:MAG: hypothetical protein R3F11_20475 [Verrucomicrobiales bacterium]
MDRRGWQPVPGDFVAGGSSQVSFSAMAEFGGELYVAGGSPASMASPSAGWQSGDGAAWSRPGDLLTGGFAQVIALQPWNGSLHCTAAFSMALAP